MKRLSIFGVAALLALAGCGGDDDNGSSGTATTGGTSTSASGGGGGGGGQQLTLSVPGNELKYDKSTLSAKAGKVTITMTNDSSLQHDVAIKGGVDAKGEVVGQGGKSVVTTDLKPGKYTFYCSVDGHEAAGMTGELDVS
jgi:plastocyanin